MRCMRHMEGKRARRYNSEKGGLEAGEREGERGWDLEGAPRRAERNVESFGAFRVEVARHGRALNDEAARTNPKRQRKLHLCLHDTRAVVSAGALQVQTHTSAAGEAAGRP